MTQDTVYLEEHPPARTQFRRMRRFGVTGAIVVHTAENITDEVWPDGGAENVARFISTRTDAAGSYHTVVDSDSIVEVGRYEWEMFHEGTGGNGWSLGLSFACRADRWPTLPASWVDGAIDRGVEAAGDMAAWVLETRGIVVPAYHLTREEYYAGRPGFIGHGELDPGRRSDPGTAFPWKRFIDQFAAYTGAPTNGDTMADTHVMEWQKYLIDTQGETGLGTTGPDRDGADGDFGPTTLERSKAHLWSERSAKLEAQAKVTTLEGTVAQLEAKIAQLEARPTTGGTAEDALYAQAGRATKKWADSMAQIAVDLEDLI